MPEVYIGIGSNQGNPISNCQRAITLLGEREGIELLEKSSLYKSEPIGYTNQPWFINGVLKIRTTLEPIELWEVLQEIEGSLGREKGPRWGPRPIDLDILFYGQLIFRGQGLIIPHPRIAERKFVLLPLAEIAPEFVHPVLKKNIRELLGEVKERQIVERLGI